jgi:beta-lactamase class A
MKYLKLLFFLSMPFYALHAQKQRLEKEIYSIIENKKATVGVAVIYDGKDTLTVNNNIEYPAMSVFKFHQALALLDYMNKNLLSLESNLFLKKSDINNDAYSPLANEHPEGNFYISIGDLLSYMVSKSDNNASDALYYYMSGTKMTDMYLRTLGSKKFSIEVTEKEMSKDFKDQYINWTTPLEAARLLEIFITKDIFCKNYKDFLFQAMTKSETGSDKLKAFLPKKVLIGHKSGSSSRNSEGLKAADNDIGFVYLPNGKQYSIAVFIKDSKEDDQTNARIIAHISNAVYKFYKNK